MKKIPLTQGKFAIVDDGDYDKLSKFKWFAQKKHYKSSITWYARRFELDPTRHYPDGKKKYRLVHMHRFILTAPLGKYIDHVNGDGLDNRKDNIRLCNPAQNSWNARWASKPDKPYKGVSKYRSQKHPGWRCHISYKGVKINMGWFKSSVNAAKSYDRLAKILFGEFARLNFPDKKIHCKVSNGNLL